MGVRVDVGEAGHKVALACREAAREGAVMLFGLEIRNRLIERQIVPCSNLLRRNANTSLPRVIDASNEGCGLCGSARASRCAVRGASRVLCGWPTLDHKRLACWPGLGSDALALAFQTHIFSVLLVTRHPGLPFSSCFYFVPAVDTPARHLPTDAPSTDTQLPFHWWSIKRSITPSSPRRKNKLQYILPDKPTDKPHPTHTNRTKHGPQV